MKLTPEQFEEYIDLKVNGKVNDKVKNSPVEEIPKKSPPLWGIYFLSACIGLFLGINVINTKNSIKKITVIDAVQCKNPIECQDFIFSAKVGGRNIKQIKWDMTIGNDTIIEHRQNEHDIVIAISDTLPSTVFKLQNTLGKLYGKYNADIYLSLKSTNINNLLELSLYGQKSWF